MSLLKWPNKQVLIQWGYFSSTKGMSQSHNNTIRTNLEKALIRALLWPALKYTPWGPVSFRWSGQNSKLGRAWVQRGRIMWPSLKVTGQARGSSECLVIQPEAVWDQASDTVLLARHTLVLLNFAFWNTLFAFSPARLKFISILSLPQPPKCWAFGHEPPHLFHSASFSQSKNCMELCHLAKHWKQGVMTSLGWQPDSCWNVSELSMNDGNTTLSKKS